MKKILLFVLASACLFNLLSAQAPTLTNANTTPKVGDSYLSQYAQTAGVSDGQSGANKTWDYSGLVDSNATILLQAVTPASTAFADSFPTSNLVIKTPRDSVIIYFNATNDAVYQLGFASVDSTVYKLTTPKIYLPYPFTYGSTFADSVVEKLPQFDFSLPGTDSLTGDGYGTLILPGKTYTGVLRIKYIETTTYTFDSANLKLTTTVRTLSYIYYAPGTHAPLLSNSTATVISSGTFFGIPVFSDTTTARDVSYLKSFVLPVTFQSFTASLQNKEISLQWKTAQETNTDHFTIQRSLSGRDFQDIATQKATGFASGSVYNVVDQNFTKGNVPPSVYYRIRETDKDGSQFFSSLVVVHGNTLTISVYPNPAGNTLQLSTKDALLADVVSIFDVNGRLVQKWKNYTVSQPLNIASLSKGTYLVKVTINNQTTTTTVVKQ